MKLYSQPYSYYQALSVCPCETFAQKDLSLYSSFTVYVNRETHKWGYGPYGLFKACLYGRIICTGIEECSETSETMETLAVAKTLAELEVWCAAQGIQISDIFYV